MGYYGNDVYYNPEKFGLELVGEIEWREEPYEFDMTIVLKKARGEYYLAHDSGCSCPSPFEDFTSIDKLDGPYDKKALKFNLEALVEADGEWGKLAEVRNILDRIK